MKLCIALLLAASTAHATEFATEPSGILPIHFPAGESDTNFSLPLSRPSEFLGSVLSITANTLTVNGAAWSDDDWVYGNGPNPSNTYYIWITSGAMEGLHYTITDSGTDTLTVDPAHATEDLETQGVQAGDTFQIIPHWTLNTVFPEGEGIHTTPNINFVQAAVIENDRTDIGVNNALASSYFYHNGSQIPEGWYQEGAIHLGIQDDHILTPDTYYVIRNQSNAQPLTLIAQGHAPTKKRSMRVSILEDQTSQDNYLANPYPVTMSLSESGLSNSPAFKVVENVNLAKETLLLFNNHIIIINLNLGRSHFYHDGSQGPEGWYREGGIQHGIQNDARVLEAGRGFVIRKLASDVESKIWAPSPPYTSQ